MHLLDIFQKSIRFFFHPAFFDANILEKKNISKHESRIVYFFKRKTKLLKMKREGVIPANYSKSTRGRRINELYTRIYKINRTRLSPVLGRLLFHLYHFPLSFLFHFLFLRLFTYFIFALAMISSIV